MSVAFSPSLPLRLDDRGVVRIGPTRVTLDSLMEAYFDGASPEEIAMRYDALSLADIYATIAYYLGHQTDVNQYLADQRQKSLEMRREVEKRQGVQNVRERLEKRMQAKVGHHALSDG